MPSPLSHPGLPVPPGTSRSRAAVVLRLHALMLDVEGSSPRMLSSRFRASPYMDVYRYCPCPRSEVPLRLLGVSLPKGSLPPSRKTWDLGHSGRSGKGCRSLSGRYGRPFNMASALETSWTCGSLMLLLVHDHHVERPGVPVIVYQQCHILPG